jgi:hypothetical protein
MNQANRDGVEKMQLLASAPMRDYQARPFQHLEVLHYAEARHLELLLELSQRLPIVLVEQVEEKAPRAVSEGSEHQVFFDHGEGYM